MVVAAARPAEVVALVKLAAAAKRMEKQVPATGEQWAFAYSILPKLSLKFAFAVHQLVPGLRDAVCVFYLVLRALDTVGGTKSYKVLMDEFHHVSQAFMELHPGYQKAIEETTRRMGAGMAKFIYKEVETIDDYDEYCHHVAGLVGYGLCRLFHAAGLEDLPPDSISNSVGLFLQKANIIKDYLEDTNATPKSRVFWPREIWNKYAERLEDFKNEENSQKAVQCLNEMVTNALIHAEDCLRCMSALKDHAILRSCAIPQIFAIGTHALCYNNVNVFRGVVKMRAGLTARIIAETNSMSDVYTAFYEFSSLLDSKIDDNDPNAALTRKRVNAIKRTCEASGLLKRRGYDLDKATCNSPLIMVVLLMVAVVLGVLYAKGFIIEA